MKNDGRLKTAGFQSVHKLEGIHAAADGLNPTPESQALKIALSGWLLLESRVLIFSGNLHRE